MKDNKNSKVYIMTSHTVRWGYVNVWNPTSINGGPPVYSMTLIISKDDNYTMERVTNAIREVYSSCPQKLLDSNGELTNIHSLKLPIRDGDKERPFDPAYKNSWFINATSKIPPLILDKDLNKITEHRQVYSGVYGQVRLEFYPFKPAIESNRKGIACCIKCLIKEKDGESLGTNQGLDSAIKDFSD